MRTFAKKPAVFIKYAHINETNFDTYFNNFYVQILRPKKCGNIENFKRQAIPTSETTVNSFNAFRHEIYFTILYRNEIRDTIFSLYTER